MNKLKKLLKGMAHLPISVTPNYIKIPVTLLNPNQENANLFNTILTELEDDPNFSKIKRSDSGGIAKGVGQLRLPAYDYTIRKNSAELTILSIEGMYRIQFRSEIYVNDSTGEKMSGRKAFLEFQSLCKANGIFLEKYAIENGLEVKATIESPLIKLDKQSYRDLTIRNKVHHIDFHSSYAGGLANTYPEFAPLLQMMYEKRKENEKFKAVLNFTVGFFQSQYTGYRFANLSKAAIEDNNRRVREVAKAVEEAGGVILLYNTDGFWYAGEIYHGPGEGNGLGEWSNDHVNCTFRAKSDGCYEYIEDGKYTPVVRGYTSLDRIKPRDQWQWGDIYSSEPELYMLTKKGIVFAHEREVVNNG